SEVLTASATSSRKDSTFAGETVCACVLSTLPMIPVGRCGAGKRRIKWVLASPRGHPLHLICEDCPGTDQHHHRGLQRQCGQDCRFCAAGAGGGRRADSVP